jgi:hypothetical protein
VTTNSGTWLVLLVWLLALLVLVRQAWGGRAPVAGLALAYWLQLCMIHGISGLLHTLGWESNRQHEVSLVGFQITGYALVGFVLGNLLAGYFAAGPRTSPPSSQPLSPDGEIRESSHRFSAVPSASNLNPRSPALIYIFVGMGLYTIVGRVLPRIPGTDAVLASGFSLAVGGFGLAWYSAWKTGRRAQAIVLLVMALCAPVLTVGLAGFLGLGVAFLVCLACLVAAHYRPRWHLAILGPLIAFVGVSLFPAYMATRTEIRRAVWGGAGYSQRFEKILLMMNSFESFDPENKLHREAIDARLNQNILVGYAVERLEAGQAEYAQGETLVNALIALIPRALWPDKPQYAGSSGLVTRFTGLQFARYTSVGIGQVMELYVNFGTLGVFAGYTLLGLLLGLLDIGAGKALIAGNWKKFTLCFMIGVAFLQVGGNFAEATSTAAGSFVLWLLVHLFLGNPEVPGRLEPAQETNFVT